MRQGISSSQAPAPIGPYSPAVKHGGHLFLSGQTPLDPATGLLVPGGIREQTHRVMENLRAVLAASGFDFGHVVKTNIYLTDMADFDAVNEVYGEYFEAPYPARTTVQVAGLPKGARVEIEMVAALPGDR